MRNSRIASIVADSFLDGLTGAALFGRLRIPGAPATLFDLRTPTEYLASGEFDVNVSKI
jgi:hypothetical protein